MHPMLRQVPPSTSRLSIIAVFRPSWAARIAPVYPAGPPPRTIRSKDAMEVWLTEREPGSSVGTCGGDVSPYRRTSDPPLGALFEKRRSHSAFLHVRYADTPKTPIRLPLD